MVYIGKRCLQVDYKIRDGAFPAKIPKVCGCRARVFHFAALCAEPSTVTRHVGVPDSTRICWSKALHVIKAQVLGMSDSPTACLRGFMPLPAAGIHLHNPSSDAVCTPCMAGLLPCVNEHWPHASYGHIAMACTGPRRGCLGGGCRQQGRGGMRSVSTVT